MKTENKKHKTSTTKKAGVSFNPLLSSRSFDIEDIRKTYDKSFPNHKKAWRHLVKASEEVGWKDIYYMILRLQKMRCVDGYKLLRSC